MNNGFPQVGQIFERRYKLLAILGCGGIATVFQALQMETGRTIALKILHVEYADDEEFKLRFMREAQLLALLTHENIVAVYHLGVSETGLPYIAMEQVIGSSLRKILTETGPLDLQRSIKIMLQCCAALGFAHQHQIVHRDIKPENIEITNEPSVDFVKIIDFGLAHVENASLNQVMTLTGELLGSVAYMSPELCEGHKIDARADVYALTISLYEILCGSQPYAADAPTGVMYKQIHDPVPQLKSPEIAEINTVIKKGLAKNPDDRYSNMLELADALKIVEAKLLAVNSNKQRVEKYRPAVIITAIVCSSLILVLIAFSSYAWLHKGDPAVRTSTMSIRKSPHKSNVEIEEEITIINAKSAHESKNYISGAKQALQLASTLPAAKHQAYLDCLKNLSMRYLALHDYTGAIKCLQKIADGKLDDSGDSPAFSKQDILVAKAITAEAYFELGDVKRAHALVKEVASWRWGLKSIEASSCTARILIKLKDYQSLRLLIENQSEPGQLLSICKVCREENQVAPAAESLAKVDTILQRNHRIEGNYSNVTMSIDFEMESALLQAKQGKTSECRKRLAALLKNSAVKGFGTTFDPSLFFEGLLSVGMDKEALSFGTSLAAKNPDLRRHCVDLFVKQQQFKAARSLITTQDESKDPQSGAYLSASKRLDMIESGKCDYKDGLEIL